MTKLSERLAPWISLAARAMMSCIFIVAGWQKITAYAGVEGFIKSLGLPGGLLPLVILVELGGSIALLLGLYTRLAAFLLTGFTLSAAILVHLHPADEENMIVFMDNLAMAGGLLLFVQYGSGAYSVDGLRRK